MIVLWVKMDERYNSFIFLYFYICFVTPAVKGADRPYRPVNLNKLWREPKRLELLTHWARMGHSIKKISEMIGIDPATLYAWIKLYPEVKEALEQGCESADEAVESALWKRAKGYSYDEVSVQYDADGKIIDRRVVTKELPPEPSLAKYWQTVRKKGDWNERIILDANVNMDMQVNEYSIIQTSSEVLKILKAKGLDVKDIVEVLADIETGTESN